MLEEKSESLEQVLSNLPEGSLEYIGGLGVDIQSLLKNPDDNDEFDPKDDVEIDSFSTFNLGMNIGGNSMVESDKVAIQEDENFSDSFDDIGLF